jgi:predicted MFS family arabinose efflux permease
VDNARIYPWYQAGRHGLFWLPVFFLYFSDVLPLERVLQLEAVYYLAVVLLEVPSGYASDALGRKPTLLVGAFAASIAGLVFATTSSFGAFVVGQILLAAAMAFNSGTDSSLLYDSLVAEGREAEQGYHEGVGQSWGFASMGAASLVGGVLAGVDHRLAYVLSAVAGMLTLVAVSRFTEPPRSVRARAPVAQVAAIVRQLRDPLSAWILAWVVAVTVFAHIPYEFVQPWLGFLLGSDSSGYEATPLAAGLAAAIAMWLGALAARTSTPIASRIGTRATLLLGTCLTGVVIASMGAAISWIIVPIVLLRSVPQALARPAMNAALHPRLSSDIRATWLSVQSLAGRLAFSAALAGTAVAVGDAQLTPPLLQTILLTYAVAVAVVVVVLGVWAALLDERVSS